jgi:hypothetical protein
MSASDQAVEIGMDLVRHASLILKGLMTAGAYAVYRKYLAGAPPTQAQATTRAVEEAARKTREEGRMMTTNQVVAFLEDVV